MEMSGEWLAAPRAEPASRRRRRRTPPPPWGTWEELVLGGAVLRHGATGWAPVAAELRLRFPYPFTPQECEAKYKDARKRFSGFDAWFEELRWRRVEELRRELEKSEDSIGSLQLKLETLKAERESEWSVDCSSGDTELPYSVINAEGADLSIKEPANDRSSAGSFVEEARSKWSPEPQITDWGSAQVISVEVSKDSILNKFSIDGGAAIVPDYLRKKRGARKRRFHGDTKDRNNDMSNSACFVDINRVEVKGSSSQHTSTSKQVPHSEHPAGHSIRCHQDLEASLDEVMKHEGVSLFCHQLESQKKARYKKMVRRHLDFQTIKSRIYDGSISSTREVLRDLLLLSNNTLLFYPKHSREHKGAIVLRGLVMKSLHEMVISAEDSQDRTTGGEVKPNAVTTIKKIGRPKKGSTGKKCGVRRPAKNSSRRHPGESLPKGRKARMA